MDGITCDNPGAVGTPGKGSTVPKEGLFSDEVNRKDFGLIPLEKQVIAFAVAGYSNAESTRSIGISEPAIRQPLAGLFDKLRVSNQFELILFALHYHLIDT
jgi:DNA-binding CsgD family transcriptional regulator